MVKKGVLVSLTQAFDQQVIDDLLFLSIEQTRQLLISADGVLRFTRLIAAGMAKFYLAYPEYSTAHYRVGLTPKGEAFVAAWKAGDRAALTEVGATG
jgi:hypothetical protein